VQPLAAGIYMADPEQLSMQAAFARFVEMEREHGSLIRAARSESASREEESGPRYSLFVAPKNGLHSLIEALAARLSKCRIETSTRIERIEHNADGCWQVTCRRDGAEASERVAGVIVAVPAFAAAPMLAPVDESLANELAGIPYEGALAVCLGFQRDQIAHPLDGFGFVVPEVEGRDVVACTFSSVKYAGRAPENSVLLRAFLGGALHTDALEWDDDRVAATTLRELNELLGIQGQPLFTRVARWDKAMPQYHLEHLQRVGRIEESVRHWGTLQLAGNAYRGVGIPQCIHSAETASERLVARLGG
jgi:oxygen-dependent protoporphyrinogen oxidase